MRRHRASGRSARGFTLTESLIASVVLAACVIGIGGTLGASYQNSQRLDENAAGTTLARQMLEEILSRSYTDGAGPSDSVFDYKGRTWADASTLTTSDGVEISLTGSGIYTRISDVSYYKSVDDIEGPGETSLSPLPPIAVVTVTVTTPLGKPIRLTQLIAQK